MYKYTLDTSSKKFRCPKCGRKRFVRYLDKLSNAYMPEKYGRCDRESSCGYFLTPTGNLTITGVIASPVAPKPTFLDGDLTKQFGNNYSNNNFVNFLLQHFSEEDVIRAIKMYYIGTTNHWLGATIFWQIDQNLNLRTGKVMLYDAITGKRVRKPIPHISWMHKVLQINNFELRQCLFGIHRLSNRSSQSKTICLVESEKSAIIMSIVLPKFLWMATGSKSNLKEALIRPLKNYTVILYPDNSEFDDWNAKCTKFNQLGYNFKCSYLLEELNANKGVDLVDLLIPV